MLPACRPIVPSDSPAASDRSKANGILNGVLHGTSKAANLPLRKEADTSAWKSIGGVQRDPKSRARSREYLKQSVDMFPFNLLVMIISRCLQEITYLTSPGALNPLPPRPPVSILGPSSPTRENGSSQDYPPQLDVAASLDRPRKALPDQIISAMYSKADETLEPVENGIKEESKDPSSSTPAIKEELESHPMRLDVTARPPSSPAIHTMGLPAELPQDGQNPENQILTAIYRPESKAAWREELRAANEKAEKVRMVS